MLCKKCKKEIPDGSVYCNHCGAKQIDPSLAKPMPQTKKGPPGVAAPEGRVDNRTGKDRGSLPF